MPKAKDTKLSDSAPTMLRLDDELKHALRGLAENAGMPLATYIRKVLKDHAAANTPKRK